MYHCAKCGRPAYLVGTLIVRLCHHTQAAVIAELRAGMEGRGGLR
jgi:hypothetical protein